MDEIIYNLKNSIIEISKLLKYTSTFSLSKVNNNTNISGDIVKNLDLLANNILIKYIKKTPCLKGFISEENDNIVITNPTGKYIISFDPLDGSSNIEFNITTGTIFCIFKNDNIKDGNDIICSGYSLYGASTQLAIAKENKLNFYQLDNKNTFQLIKENHKIPINGKYYAINHSNYGSWNENIKNMIKYFSNNKSLRYVGSLVADAHRTLINGGIFFYPLNTKTNKGKIRLLYEAYPFAYIFKTSGGYSHNEEKSILDIKFNQDNIHMDVSIILMSKEEYIKYISLR